MIPAATLTLLGAVAYVLAYAATWAGAEAGHLSRLLASVPRDPSPSQARALVERIGQTRCPECRRPGIVRVAAGGISAGIAHRRWCSRHPRHHDRPRHSF